MTCWVLQTERETLLKTEFPTAGQKPVSDAANPTQTPALGGGGRPTAVDQPSPWNTPAVQPPSSASLSLTDNSSGESAPQCSKQPFFCPSHWPNQ